MSKRVEFLASIPPLQSALTIAGDGGGRLKFDFDDTQTAAVLHLLELRGELLRVSVEKADAKTPCAGARQ